MVWNRIRMRREPEGSDIREIVYVLAALVCGSFASLVLSAERGAGFGKLACLLALPFTVGASYAGAKIADVLRRIARPDGIAVKGTLGEILSIKFYWYIGIQLIGAFVGALLMMELITSMFQEPPGAAPSGNAEILSPAIDAGDMSTPQFREEVMEIAEDGRMKANAATEPVNDTATNNKETRK